MPYKNKDKQKEFQRKWMATKREEVLKNKVCLECGTNESLVFVNIKNGGKKFSLSYSIKNLNEKINSAIILCDFHYTLYNKKRKKESSTKHGHTGSATYISWAAMIDRCFNVNKDNYKWYGAKGVTVCERWEKFENFLEDMGERPSGMTLDRKDPFGNYEANNCRWATPMQQGANKRRNVSRPPNDES
jgi:hypothetical protein